MSTLLNIWISCNPGLSFPYLHLGKPYVSKLLFNLSIYTGSLIIMSEIQVAPAFLF